MLSQGRPPVASIQRYKQEGKKTKDEGKEERPRALSQFPILFRSIPSAYHEQLKDQQTSVLRIAMMRGFSPASPTRIFWNSRKRSATVRSLEESLKSPVVDRRVVEPAGKTVEAAPPTETAGSGEANPEEDQGGAKPEISERRRALFEPLEPTGGRTPAELLLPPPDFDTASYPKGWLVGKKRKLVNVDVVESMRRIAVQEMNRKDKEINGLNEQLEEDARCLEHLQLQLLDERSKRAEAERQNAMLQDQISMLMNMLEATDAIEDDTSAHHH